VTFSQRLSEVTDIIRAHVGRVIRSTSRRVAVHRDDLEQAARIGAWRAWESWDETRSSWRTWASHWVRAYVEREAWGETTRRRGEKATALRTTTSLDAPLAAVLPSPAPSPEQRAIDAERLRIARRHLLRKQGRRSVMDGRRAMRAWLSGVDMRSIAKREGVSFQAVSLQMRERLESARAALEAA